MDSQNVQLDPAEILAEDNSRWGLKKSGIEALADSIEAEGKVLQPVGVVPLPKAEQKSGTKYRLIWGFYRHAAALKLNTEKNAGVLLPAVVLEPSDAMSALKTQLAENMKRENQSPMDKAVAIKKLLDGQVPRGEIRQMFATVGGKKGNEVRPMSNAMLNIYVRFLELPKAIQEKIHDGRVGVEAAYELGKVAPDKRQAVLDRAEADRLAQLAQEEKDEQRYLTSEQKLTEAVSQEQEAIKTADQKREEIVAAEKVAAEKRHEVMLFNKMPMEEFNLDTKANVEKKKALDASVKAAEKIVKDLKNELAASLKKKETAAELAERRRGELEATRKLAKRAGKAGAGKKTAVGKSDVKKAAAAEGSPTGLVALSLADIRQAVKDVSNHKGNAAVAAIGKAFLECFNGKTTPKLLIDELTAILAAVANPPAPKAVSTPAAATVKPAKAQAAAH